MDAEHALLSGWSTGDVWWENLILEAQELMDFPLFIDKAAQLQQPYPAAPGLAPRSSPTCWNNLEEPQTLLPFHL